MIEIPVYSAEIHGASILRVSVGTTGFKGGDCGHGGRALLRLEDISATAWRATVDGKPVDMPRTVELIFGGDYEMENLLTALEFAAARLREGLGSGGTDRTPVSVSIETTDF